MKISGVYDYNYDSDEKYAKPLRGEISPDIYMLCKNIECKFDVTPHTFLLLAWLPSIREIVVTEWDELCITFESGETTSLCHEPLAKYFRQEIEREMELK